MRFFRCGHSRIMKPPANADMPERAGVLVRINSALFYGICSFLMIFINKFVLTVLEFPSFIVFALLQMFSIVICLFLVAQCGFIKLPKLDSTIPRRIFPLPLFFLIGMITGLGGIQRINLPMFTALRHTTIFITMVLEYAVLGTVPSNGVKLSVLLIISGSLLAAVYDLAFDLNGYLLIFINNFAGALNGVVLKQKLDAKDLDSYSLLFYNSFFMIPIGLLLAVYFDEFSKAYNYFEHTSALPLVVSSMLMAFFFGLMLNYSTIKCTEYNSALTTTFVGATKNTAITYIGMFSSGDYIFQFLNFIGISITVVGSSLYIYVTFNDKARQSAQDYPVKTCIKV